MLAVRYNGDFGVTDAIRLVTARPSTYLFERLSTLRRVIAVIVDFRRMVDENVSLKAQNESLMAERASVNAIVEENVFLRRALNLAVFTSKKVKVAANIYSLSRNVFGYDVMLNRGLRDGIFPQQAVITQHGVLVGVTQEVFHSTARILLVSDPSFSATARVFGGSTAGIARGNGSSGLLLDLVVREDLIAPQDRIVTSGDDVFSPGLTLGVVSEVISRPDQVFKRVIIKPSAEDFFMGPVLVISRE